MADIVETAPISPALPIPNKRDRNKEKKRPPQEKPERPPMRENVSDVTFIMGIPAEEVTEKVQEAISLIMNEIDHLRAQLNFAHEKIDYLEELSEEHPFLPLMNHRGLLRELARIISHTERTGTTNSFLCIHIQNIADIRRAKGHRAAKIALSRAAEIILENILDTDIAGSLGGDDIGVIHTIADKEETTKKAEAIIQALERADEPIRLQAVFGIHVLEAGETAGEAIEAADENLRIGEVEKAGKSRRRSGRSRRAKNRREEDD